ncbi:hypothetical protein CO612_07130 [Lysobacteraceae bacterium NML71-0210]|nr:hypothetical protein CO612_07130 [Xanthomonadaceae bacterium NML71-0210]
MKSSSLTVAIAAVLACACANAQTLPRPTPSQDKLLSPQLLDRTRVFADTPLPASGQSFSGAKLQAARTIQRDSAGLLKQFAGAEVQAAGGLSGLPLIHGMAGDRNRVQVDGMDLIASCPNHMNPPLSYIDPANIGHIRVFTAISPVSAGGDSIGGSIAVESRAPAFAASADEWQLGGHLGLRYHSNGHARHADASLWLANERWHLRYEATTTKPKTTAPPSRSVTLPPAAAKAMKSAAMKSPPAPIAHTSTACMPPSATARICGRGITHCRPSRNRTIPISAWTCSITASTAGNLAIRAKPNGAAWKHDYGKSASSM